MTLLDVFNAVSGQPVVLLVFLIALPIGAFFVNKWSGTTADGIYSWRYVYTSLIYISCILGVFTVTLDIYLLVFERQSLLDVNLPLQVLPILTSVTTLMVIQSKIPFQYIPGFGRLPDFVTIIAILISALWFIDRASIYPVSYVPFFYIIVGFGATLIAVRYAWSRLFRLLTGYLRMIDER